LLHRLLDEVDGWLAMQWRSPPALPAFPANREFYSEIFEILALPTSKTSISIT
jgi:hypothetical protein